MLAPGMLLVGALIAGASGPSGRWVGQDGHDVVGPSAEVKPSDVQDIHIVLDGLAATKTVVHAIVTSLRGDEWQYQGKSGRWAAVLERAPKSPRGDLYVEPARVEMDCPITVKLRFDDGTDAELSLIGRRTNPDLRMPGAALSVTWLGQQPSDCVSPGASVGPDGLQDVRLALGGLSPSIEVKAILIEGPANARWRFGVNAEGDSNAELVRDPKDRTRAALCFQPEREMNGQRLKLTIGYANGKSDVATVQAGRFDPGRRMPEVRLPRPIAHAIEARWLGQDASRGGEPGDVHVAITGLSAGRTIAAAALSDSVRGYWVHRSEPSDRALIANVGDEAPLVLRRGNDPTRAQLSFAPVRDESDRTLTLRLVFNDGTMAIVRFPGGACDLRLRVPDVAGTTVVARPGDDLNGLVLRNRTVKLTRGTYRLSRPLVLDRMVTLLGEPGATLLFAQAADQPPWSAAITVHGSRTTLDGFAVRFAGPVRWKSDVPWGPALIGVTETTDAHHPDPRIGLTVTHLDLEAPPASNPGGWEDAPRLLRLVGARGGRVAGNRLKGGPVELAEGPWEIVENDFRGTVPGTVSPCIIGAHHAYDLVVRGNRARPVGPSGKTWRFLVLTGSGAGDRIEANVVVAIGPRDDDTIPPANAPEVVLTEAYHLHFEGKPAAIAPDGMFVHLGQGEPLGPPARVGAVVAVVSGEHPGHWRRIAQVIDRGTFLLDESLPAGTDRIAIATGFVDETFARNTIDSRGGSEAANLILAGNHFGTRVVENHLLGGGDAFQITAFPSESPGIWGWSHAPCLGVLIAGNTIEDAERGGTLGVMHSEHTKSNRGRTYLSATLRDNTVKWTAAFLREPRLQVEKAPPPGLTIGFRASLDPAEQIVQSQGNRLDAPDGTRPSATFRVRAAILNGVKVVDKQYPLPRVSSSTSGGQSGPAVKAGRGGGNRRQGSDPRPGP